MYGFPFSCKNKVNLINFFSELLIALYSISRNNICGNSSKSFEVKTERSIGYKNNIECGEYEDLNSLVI